MPHSVRRPSGHLITTPIDGGREVHRDTLSCCTRCNGPVCGEECAKKCVPLEQMIGNFEKGRELDYRPIFSAGGLVLPASATSAAT